MSGAAKPQAEGAKPQAEKDDAEKKPDDKPAPTPEAPAAGKEAPELREAWIQQQAGTARPVAAAHLQRRRRSSTRLISHPDAPFAAGAAGTLPAARLTPP